MPMKSITCLVLVATWSPAFAQSETVSLVDESCLSASKCRGLGSCYSGTREFLNRCLSGRSFVVDSLIHHPVLLPKTCEALGFVNLTDALTYAMGTGPRLTPTT